MVWLSLLTNFVVLCPASAWSSGWSWSALQVAAAPTARQGHAAVEVGRKIYVIGGCLQEIRCYNDVHIFDTGAQRWTQENVTGDLPSPRGGHTATLVGSDIFLLGGANSEATFADAYRLDLLRRRWTKLEEGVGLTMTARTSHAAAADGGRIYVFGGYDADGKFLNDMWVLRAPLSPPYSPDAPEVVSRPRAAWTRPVPTGEVPAGRQGHSLTSVDRQLVLFGGSTADGSDVNDVYTYDTSAGSWKQLPVAGAAPLPRKAHSALRHGRSLVVAGGCTSAAHCFSDVWRLDLASHSWSQRMTDSALQWRQREGHSAAFVGAQMFVFGGCQVSECFNDVEVLNTEEPCPDQCGGHGHCVENLYCQCTEPGFTGHDCLQPLACAMDCGSNGACGQNGRCVCSGGFSGATCETPPRCPGSPLPCSGRGECLPGGTCRCQSGAAGADCFADAAHNQSQPVSLRSRLVQSFLSLGESQEQPPVKPSVHPDPITTADFGIAKANEDGHAGENLSPDCEDFCNWRGLCEAGVCYCQPGFSGRTCSNAKENTEVTVNILGTGLFVGSGFVASMATTLAMLSAQKGQKRAKEREAGYNI